MPGVSLGHCQASAVIRIRIVVAGVCRIRFRCVRILVRQVPVDVVEVAVVEVAGLLGYVRSRNLYVGSRNVDMGRAASRRCEGEREGHEYRDQAPPHAFVESHTFTEAQAARRDTPGRALTAAASCTGGPSAAAPCRLPCWPESGTGRAAGRLRASPRVRRRTSSWRHRTPPGVLFGGYSRRDSERMYSGSNRLSKMVTRSR
jgi:hypothetical protein